jgi:hypothetical protein
MTRYHRSAAIACTLTSADLAAQRDRWERLAARAMAERAETADGLRLVFRPDPGAEDELRALVAVESECCSWAEWAVEADGGRIVLTVHATGEGVATLHAAFLGCAPFRPERGAVRPPRRR